MLRTLAFSLFTFSILACKSAVKSPPPVSFYYWKTTIAQDVLSGDTSGMYNRRDAPIFLRFFDVDYSAGYGEPVPVGDLDLSYKEANRTIIPVVFITNRVFTQSKAQQLDSLPVKIARRIQARLKGLSERAWWEANPNAYQLSQDSIKASRDSFMEKWTSQYIPEIQIDCDWTPTTRAAYFHFLENFKKEVIVAGRTLSCTIRLHQYRDRKDNGTPPVQRGTLMCYNMSSPRDTSAQNAIFDLGLLEGYLKSQPDYLLPLDVALPMFSWGAWFRSGTFRGLLGGWNAATLSDTTYFRTLGTNMYQLRRDTVWGGDYLREGDLVRLDAPAEDALIDAVPLLKPVMGADSRLLFFDWDPAKKTQYERLIPSILARF